MIHKRRTVADMRGPKGERQMTMLFVETQDEARAAADAGIDMLSIIDPIGTAQMLEAAGNCFVQVGLLYGQLCTFEDYLRAAHRAMQAGSDCVYCAASLSTTEGLTREGIPVVGHVGLIPSKATWTGGFKAVGETADSALLVWRQVTQRKTRTRRLSGCHPVHRRDIPLPARTGRAAPDPQWPDRYGKIPRW